MATCPHCGVTSTEDKFARSSCPNCGGGLQGQGVGNSGLPPIREQTPQSIRTESVTSRAKKRSISSHWWIVLVVIVAVRGGIRMAKSTFDSSPDTTHQVYDIDTQANIDDLMRQIEEQSQRDFQAELAAEDFSLETANLGLEEGTLDTPFSPSEYQENDSGLPVSSWDTP